MPETATLPVQQLKLDLRNFRTIPQKSEAAAVRAMISVNPDWFWALAESLLQDGYHPTENILVLKTGKLGKELVVKEGNRRVAVLKLSLGFVRRTGIAIPAHVIDQMAAVDDAWKAANANVPCAIYSHAESPAIDRIVTLTHGKGERAGRDKWKAVARARHNRDVKGANEPSLDLLESYLWHGKNLTNLQKDRWAGDYPLTVLEEAMKRLSPRFGVATPRELADHYPNKVTHRAAIEEILKDIGLEALGFSELRDKNEDFALTRYRVPAIQPAPASSHGTTKPTTAVTGGTSPTSHSSTPAKLKAVSLDDPRAVIRQLKRFVPMGNNREKVVTLLDEARTIKLSTQPHAFCFLLRSMFEISAKAYCRDHQKAGGPTATKATGDDRALVDVLRDITTHLTKSKTDKAMTKALHGAMAELAKQDGFLSVTSMNQLVHNPKFSVKDTHICALFANIFPLLEAMNS